ncbi:hypothetical protein HHK36_026649 [Tetracentron sinense]|uniref:Protein FAR1-RELATED SEQUENCE n=1 Tax=Tetracentron sinense TaxID=13715 RepID=A0A834YJU7_TETSI|nr:hypothetical protein HHK36_026649 [Tetracentron sinense]
MNGEECGKVMVVKTSPVGDISVKNHVNGDDKRESKLEPYVGLEFDSADDAREFYSAYAVHSGFSIRVGQLSRSKTDGSITARKFVCSKEGFQLHSRVGCRAFIKVQRQESGRWAVECFQKDHNHILESSGKVNPPRLHEKTPMASRSLIDVFHEQGAGLPATVSALKEVSVQTCPSGVVYVKHRTKGEDGESKLEPYVGLEFNSINEAYKSYKAYAIYSGFNSRIGQLYRSRANGSITSRRFVCSKEGFQHHSRVGCRAFIRIQKQESGKWVVDRFQKVHNHDLDSSVEGHLPCSHQNLSTTLMGYDEKATDVGLENVGFVGKDDSNYIKGSRRNNIGNDWYRVLLEYFQSKQAEDPGFFYSIEVVDGRCMSIFWADGRSRFSCSQFGDVVVFDTRYRTSTFLVPFASFIGVNHHKQPVLLGCALIADESKESLTWLFETLLRAMSGRRPLSVIADQDVPMRQAIAQVFSGTRYRFSTWQIKAKERENLSCVHAAHKDFKYEYENCIHHSQTPHEFESAWKALINKYNLKDNDWLREMYEKREFWVPLYLRDTFFAGITESANMTSFFGTLVNAQTPLCEFVLRYERALERRREEERKEDFLTLNSRMVLNTKAPIQEQCEGLYTRTMFKVFQTEFLECDNFAGKKIYEEGIMSRYLVHRYMNENEKHTVTLNISNLNVSCSCRMFEFEGMLCRHVLRVFQKVNIMEVPSRYILHRWTRDAEYGIVRDVVSGGSSKDHRVLMEWSLREEARKYIESGATSLERYSLAFKILQEGRRTLGPVMKMIPESSQSENTRPGLKQSQKRHRTFKTS